MGISKFSFFLIVLTCIIGCNKDTEEDMPQIDLPNDMVEPIDEPLDEYRRLFSCPESFAGSCEELINKRFAWLNPLSISSNEFNTYPTIRFGDDDRLYWPYILGSQFVFAPDCKSFDLFDGGGFFIKNIKIVGYDGKMLILEDPEFHRSKLFLVDQDSLSGGVRDEQCLIKKCIDCDSPDCMCNPGEGGPLCDHNIFSINVYNTDMYKYSELVGDYLYVVSYQHNASTSLVRYNMNDKKVEWVKEIESIRTRRNIENNDILYSYSNSDILIVSQDATSGSRVLVFNRYNENGDFVYIRRHEFEYGSHSNLDPQVFGVSNDEIIVVVNDSFGDKIFSRFSKDGLFIENIDIDFPRGEEVRFDITKSGILYVATKTNDRLALSVNKFDLFTGEMTMDIKKEYFTDLNNFAFGSSNPDVYLRNINVVDNRIILTVDGIGSMGLDLVIPNETIVVTDLDFNLLQRKKIVNEQYLTTGFYSIQDNVYYGYDQNIITKNGSDNFIDYSVKVGFEKYDINRIYQMMLYKDQLYFIGEGGRLGDDIIIGEFSESFVPDMGFCE